MSWFGDSDGHREAALKGLRRLGRVVVLLGAAGEGLKSNPKNCNRALAGMLSHFGYDHLENKTANEQVAFFEAKWKAITATEAADIAADGGIAVAGLMGGWKTDGKGRKVQGSGHVGLIVPGKGYKRRGRVYPNIVCGSSSHHCPKGSKVPFGYSDGSKSTGEVWNQNDRDNVKYFTPK